MDRHEVDRACERSESPEADFQDIIEDPHRSINPHALLPPSPMARSSGGLADAALEDIRPTKDDVDSRTKVFDPRQPVELSVSSLPSHQHSLHTPHLDNPDHSAVLTPTNKVEQKLPIEKFHVLTKPSYYPLAMSNFAVDKDVKGIVPQVHDFLNTESVDFQVQPNICKWKCCNSQNACHVEFQLRVWRVGLKNVLEFMIQRGDRPTFENLFRMCKGRLTHQTIPQALHFSPKPLASPTAPGDFDHLITRLVEMVATLLPDAAIEGTRALAHLSAQSELRPVLVNKEVIPCLQHFLEVEHIRNSVDHVWLSCRLFSVSCLANLSEEPMLRDSLYETTALFVELVGEGDFRDRAMRREATRALRNLAQDACGADQIIQRVGRAKLQMLSQSVFPALQDRQMQLNVADIQSNLERRWLVCG